MLGVRDGTVGPPARACACVDVLALCDPGAERVLSAVRRVRDAVAFLPRPGPPAHNLSVKAYLRGRAPRDTL
jgi:hypothetical protein